MCAFVLVLHVFDYSLCRDKKFMSLHAIKIGEKVAKAENLGVDGDVDESIALSAS